jgi:hypothetical protein
MVDFGRECVNNCTLAIGIKLKRRKTKMCIKQGLHVVCVLRDTVFTLYIHMIHVRRMIWVRHVACMGERRGM